MPQYLHMIDNKNNIIIDYIINFDADESVIINAPKLYLGLGATEPLVKGTQLTIMLDDILEALRVLSAQLDGTQDSNGVFLTNIITASDSLGKSVGRIKNRIKKLNILLNKERWTSKAPLAAHPLTKDGQKKFVLSLEKLLRQQPANRGLGLWWWEPMAMKVLSSNGAITWNGGMANSALIDSDGRALPALSALNGQ